MHQKDWIESYVVAQYHCLSPLTTSKTTFSQISQIPDNMNSRDAFKGMFSPSSPPSSQNRFSVEKEKLFCYISITLSHVCAKFPSSALRHVISFLSSSWLLRDSRSNNTGVCVSGLRREGRVGCLQIQTLRFRERHRQWLEGKINGSSIARRELQRAATLFLAAGSRWSSNIAIPSRDTDARRRSQYSVGTRLTSRFNQKRRFGTTVIIAGMQKNNTESKRNRASFRKLERLQRRRPRREIYNRADRIILCSRSLPRLEFSSIVRSDFAL